MRAQRAVVPRRRFKQPYRAHKAGDRKLKLDDPAGLLGGRQMSVLSGLFTRFLLTTDAGISVPPMDGVFKPNNRLEEAESVVALPDIDNLAATPSGLVCSSGSKLLLIAEDPGKFAP